MPAIEPRVAEVIFVRDARGVEGTVVRVAQADVREALVVALDEAVADDLDLGLVGDGLEVWVEDGALGIEGLAVAVGALGERVEALREFVLGAGRDVVLRGDDDDLVGEDGGAKDGEVGIWGG